MTATTQNNEKNNNNFERVFIGQSVHSFVKKNNPKALAALLGKSVSTLYHEADPASDAHKFGFLDAVEAMKHSGDIELLQTICAYLGYTLIPIRKYEGACDIEVLTMYARFHKEIGDLAAATSAAFDDHVVTSKEYAKIHKEWLETISAFYSFLARVESIMEH